MCSERLADTGAEALRARLRHVYWTGGGSGAGKSTVAHAVADRYGLSVYSTDNVMSDHSARCGPQECPYLNEFKAMDMDERWVSRSPDVMLETFHWFRGEGFELIVEDLLRLPARPGVVVEGFRLLPKLVQPLLAVTRQAVWLLPTPDFRVYALRSRGTLWAIPNKTNDPPKALRNILERDGMFTERLREQVLSLGLQFIDVDARMTQEALVERVAKIFGLEP